MIISTHEHFSTLGISQRDHTIRILAHHEQMQSAILHL